MLGGQFIKPKARRQQRLIARGPILREDSALENPAQGRFHLQSIAFRKQRKCRVHNSNLYKKPLDKGIGRKRGEGCAPSRPPIDRTVLRSCAY